MIKTLDVYLWNRKVGSLLTYKEKYAAKICFYFDEKYIKDGYDLAPLRASIKSTAVQHGLPVYGDDDKLFGGLPSFIADSLPDHWGNRVFNEWAKANNIKSRDLSPLDRLSYIGRRGLGAIEFLPPIAEDLENPFKVEIDNLYKLAQMTLNEAKRLKAEMHPNLMIESLFKVGTSAGGRRPKAIINVNPDTNEYFSGQVASPQPGFIPMLIKFDEHINIPTTYIEYSYYLMAIDAGIKMMPSKLIKEKNATHFITERFDRNGNEKIHIQTLAAMNPLSNSYEDLFDTAYKIGITSKELQQLFLSMTMNVLAGNIDDHNKNFSFMMNKDGMWHITPTYDFTFTIDTSAPGYINHHSMTINGKNSNIERIDLIEIAKKYDIKDANALIEKATNTVCNFYHYAQQAELDNKWITKIQEEIKERVDILNK